MAGNRRTGSLASRTRRWTVDHGQAGGQAGKHTWKAQAQARVLSCSMKTARDRMLEPRRAYFGEFPAALSSNLRPQTSDRRPQALELKFLVTVLLTAVLRLLLRLLRLVLPRPLPLFPPTAHWSPVTGHLATLSCHQQGKHITRTLGWMWSNTLGIADFHLPCNPPEVESSQPRLAT